MLCDKQPYLTASNFKIHLAAKHPIVPEAHYPTMMRSCQEPLSFVPALDCPFCDTWEAALRDRQAAGNPTPTASTEGVLVVSWRQFRRHVASHLEQLALFAARSYIIEEQLETDSHGAVDAMSAKGSLPTLKPEDFASEPESSKTSRNWQADVDELESQASSASQEVPHNWFTAWSPSTYPNSGEQPALLALPSARQFLEVADEPFGQVTDDPYPQLLPQLRSSLTSWETLAELENSQSHSDVADDGSYLDALDRMDNDYLNELLPKPAPPSIDKIEMSEIPRLLSPSDERRSPISFSTVPTTGQGGYKCDYPGCTAPPFQTAYLLRCVLTS
jgi:hypothetical protein